MQPRDIARARRMLEDIRSRADELDELLTRFEISPSKGLELHPISAGKILLTVAEAAVRLNVSRTALYTMVLRGDVRSIKLGKSRRIPVTELDRFVRQFSE